MALIRSYVYLKHLLMALRTSKSTFISIDNSQAKLTPHEYLWSENLLLVSDVVEHYAAGVCRHHVSELPMTIVDPKHLQLAVRYDEEIILILLVRHVEIRILAVVRCTLFGLELYLVPLQKVLIHFYVCEMIEKSGGW